VKISKSILACIVAAWLCPQAAPAQSTQSLKDSFVQCAGNQAVTGREARFIEYLKGRLPQGVKSEIDNMGNLIVTVGDGAPQVLVVTSVDEPGFVVTDITEEGYLRVASPGGRAPNSLFYQFHEGHYVDIASRTGTIRGVVALPSSHLVRGRRESLSLDRCLIDIGARSRQEALARGVEMLDPAVAAKDIALLAENRVAGPMLSRKFGAFALLEVLKNFTAKAGKGVVFAWTTQSAMSNNGAARIARRFAVKQVVVVGAFQRTGARSGKEPVETLDGGVLVPDNDSPDAASPLLRAAAGAAGSQIKLMPSATGMLPEARAFGANVDSFAVAIPVFFPGSLVETIDMDDLQQLINFIRIVLYEPRG
jgi:putative aminopeptidase FrvX